MTWVVRAIRSSEGVARLRSVAFSSSTMHDRDEIWVAKGRRRAGDGDLQPTWRVFHVTALVAKGRRRAGDGDGPDSPGRLTKNRTLQPEPHGKAQFGWSEARRMRLSVRTRAQNALFRHVAAPGRCGATPPPGCGALWRMSQLGKCARATPRQAAGWVARGFANLGLEFGLTENRILQPEPHGKAHSAPAPHQKPHSVLAVPPQHGTAPLSPHSSPREWCSKRPFS